MNMKRAKLEKVQRLIMGVASEIQVILEDDKNIFFEDLDSFKTDLREATSILEALLNRLAELEE